MENGLFKDTIPLIMKGIFEIMYSKYKIIYLLIYFMISILLVPFIKNISIGNIYLVSDIVEWVMRIILYICLILGAFLVLMWIGRPIKTTKMRKNFEKIGLVNHMHETPIFLRRKRGNKLVREEILQFSINFIPLEVWHNKSVDLEVVFNKKITNIEYCKNTRKKIEVRVIPLKYYTPRLITTTNDFLSDVFNLLVVGATGTGKSYLLLVILGKIAKFNERAKIVICDYKKMSFSQFADCPNFYGYTDCLIGIETVYNEFHTRLEKNDKNRNNQQITLVIDEYASLVSSQEKKISEDLKRKVAEMLQMSRSLGITVIIGLQRGDSEVFKFGSRDNFRNIIGLGNLSKEQKTMLFHDYKELMSDTLLGLGEGYLLRDGEGLERIRVAPIENMDELINDVKKAMSKEI